MKTTALYFTLLTSSAVYVQAGFFSSWLESLGLSKTKPTSSDSSSGSYIGGGSTPRRVRCPGSSNSALNPKCCVWYDVLDYVQDELFSGGQCDEVAHDSLRLTFHDAIGISKSRTRRGQWGGGGADGSIMKWMDTDQDELNYGGNTGLDEIVHELKPVADKFGVSYGDIIQFAGAVGVGNCAGGPKIEFLAGRPDAKRPAPEEGLLPGPGDSVDSILARMDDGGFTPDELVDLLASHSIGFQEHMDSTIEYTPFDPTPEALDSQFFLDTLLKGTIDMGAPGGSRGEALSPREGEYRLQSDAAVARDPRTACRWQRYILDQKLMQENFAKAMAKMAITGNKRSDLDDCSEVIPQPKNAYVEKAVLPVGLKWKDIEFSCTREAIRLGYDVKADTGKWKKIGRAFSKSRGKNNGANDGSSGYY